MSGPGTGLRKRSEATAATGRGEEGCAGQARAGKWSGRGNQWKTDEGVSRAGQAQAWCGATNDKDRTTLKCQRKEAAQSERKPGKPRETVCRNRRPTAG